MAKPRTKAADSATENAIAMRVSVMTTSTQIGPAVISVHSTFTTTCGAGMTLDGSIAAPKYQSAMSVRTDAVLMNRSAEGTSIHRLKLRRAGSRLWVSNGAGSGTPDSGHEL